MEINANHLLPVMSGWVTRMARPVSLGRRSQVWQVQIVDDHDKLVCISALHDGGDRRRLAAQPDVANRSSDRLRAWA